MSLARAFTKRREKRNVDDAAASVPPTPTRSSARESVKMINRSKISMPVALLSTTNMLSYNAPDIEVYRQQKKAEATRQVSSSSSSTHSDSADDHSDGSSVSSQKNDSFITDASSVEESPIDRSPSIEENHLSRYFPSTKTIRRSVSTSDMNPRVSVIESPAIPKRAPSHSKRAHEASLARKRSLQVMDRESVNSTILSTPSIASQTLSHARSTSAQSMRSNTTNLRSSNSFRDSSLRTSLDIFRANVEPNHPFGKELEQLNEVAEEFVDTVRDAEWEADAQVMKQRGLVRLCANDYLQEITPLFGQTGLYAPLVSTDGGFF